MVNYKVSSAIALPFCSPKEEDQSEEELIVLFIFTSFSSGRAGAGTQAFWLRIQCSFHHLGLMEDLCAQSGLIAVPWLTQVEGTEAAVLGPLGNKPDSPARLVFPASSLTLANSQFYQASKNFIFFPCLKDC